MNKKLFYTVAPLTAFALLANATISTAQDIEFMGKNGEKVQLTPKVEALPDDQPLRMALPDRPGIDVGPLQPHQRGRALGSFGDLRGRTFTVTDDAGNTKEISTDDARSIVVNRSFSSVNENGVQQLKQGGTAIIVDADGQRYEIDLGQLDDGDLAGAPLQAKPVEVEKSYMIGVFCEPAPEMLRSQLNLGEDIGLIVEGIQDGSPAAEAGLKKFDILLYADDKSLATIADLTGVISETGGASQPFTLTVMRGGEELPIEVTPVEREMTAGLMPGIPGRLPMGGFEMNDLGPGLIFGGDFDNDMMQKMQNHMRQVREEMKRMDGLLQNQVLPMPPMRTNPKQSFR